jgi:hypothetical protein
MRLRWQGFGLDTTNRLWPGTVGERSEFVLGQGLSGGVLAGLVLLRPGGVEARGAQEGVGAMAKAWGASLGSGELFVPSLWAVLRSLRGG